MSQPWMNCTACRTRSARRHTVYVITRADCLWSKIGITHALGKRMATYRKKGLVVDVAHRLDVCCQWSARLVESAAHERLEKTASRREGDWFDAPADASVAALTAAISSSAVRNYI